eukprot:gene7576-730_t
MDIDVVCANTVEHGIRSLAEERFANNPTAGNAARMVKVMATCAQIAAPVKNYHLELLTLLAQEAAAARGGARVADDSMQLVLDVLQSIADDKMPTTGAAETQADLSKDQFRGLVSGLKVTLVYGNLAPGSLKRPFYSNHLAVVVGMSVVMEDLTFVVPDLPGVTAGHCIYLINQAQLYARGCNFSSPKYPCIGAGSGAHCRLIDCCFGPDKERGASAGVVVEGSSNLVAERCLFLRCREAAVEVRGASRGQLKGCKFIKCQKQAVMLYNGGKELVMEDCLIERCGDLTMHHLLLVACGTAQLHKCSFLSNKIDVVMVQCDNQQSAPEVDMRECILKGNMSGVTFGFDEGGRINSGSGILVNNQITDHASYGISIQDVAPNQQVKLIGNVFQDNGPNFGLGKIDILMFQNVQDQVAVKNNRGTIHIRPFSGSDALDVFRRSGRH